MWKGFEEALGRYGLVCCEVWTGLGHGDTCALTIAADLRTAGIPVVRTQAELAEADALPPWLGDEELHRSHRSALVRKDPAFYGPRFPGVPDDLPYVWPVRSEAAVAAELRRAESARLRAERAAQRRLEEAARLRRRRSRAAKKAWATRRRNAALRASPPPEVGG
ncbi:MSMEG_6728 family protein [Nocardioides panacisoli]